MDIILIIGIATLVLIFATTAITVSRPSHATDRLTVAMIQARLAAEHHSAAGAIPRGWR